MKNRLFYNIKPFVPRTLQLHLRRQMLRIKRVSCDTIWPIDETAGEKPLGWQGWPGGKQFALVLTHDVDTARGQGKCCHLADLEEKAGFRSSFNFVPERYDVQAELRNPLISRGFEVGVHGLNHDGKLYTSRTIFQKRAIKINSYLKEWQSAGFRSPAMHHNLEWLHDLNIEYDASTFDTDPFEPQSDGVGTIFPFKVKNQQLNREYVELPYTIPQDFTIFILMRDEGLNIWKKKLDWVASMGGMVLLNSHPDYMCFNGIKTSIEEYPSDYYFDFLKYIKRKYAGQYWHVLPRDMARFWKKYTNTPFVSV